MDIKEFKPAFMELISPNLAKHEIQQGVCIVEFFENLFFFLLIKNGYY